MRIAQRLSQFGALALVGFVFAVGGGGLGYLTQATPVPVLAQCDRVSGTNSEINVLIVGESWATGTKLFPDLLNAVSARNHGRPVHACAISFSGRNAGNIYRELVSDYSRQDLTNMFGGATPDAAILLVGVNDIVQHVGAKTYAADVQKLVAYLPSSQTMVISVPRIDEVGARPGSLLSLAKRSIYRWINDGGASEVADRYREMLSRESPSIAQLNYDLFVSSYPESKALYAADGIHLTGSAFHRYGSFLGDAIQISRGDLGN